MSRPVARQRATARAWLVASGLLALALLFGCDEVRPPRFPHRAHLVATECGGPGQPDCASCVSCHGGIRQSEQRATEPPSDCARCHDPASEQVQAEHRRLVQSMATPRAIEFEHAVHLPLDEVRGQCTTCHEGISHDGLQGELHPPMSQCLDCHDDLFQQGSCVSCHRGSDWRRQAPRTFARHDLGFVLDHRVAAAGQAQVCNGCHGQSECVDCHDSSQTLPLEVRHADDIDRELPHRTDYLSRHAIDARSRPASCLRCHATTSCDGCHVARGVSAARAGSVNPHPIGWLGSSAAANFHGRRARRDVISCAGCHDRGPATNCIRCHQVGAHGGNPHPSGWSSEQAESEGMCVYCHTM